MGNEVKIHYFNSNDNRSYHISSEKIKRELGYKTIYNIEDSVKDLKQAFEQKKLINCLDNIEYYNIKKMQKINLK